jgi:hypothetical protein
VTAERGNHTALQALPILFLMKVNECFNGRLLAFFEITAIDQVIGQREVLIANPAMKCGDQGRLIDESSLERKQAEQQVVVHIAIDHDS